MTQEQIDSFLIEAMRNAGYKTVKLEDGTEVTLDTLRPGSVGATL